MTPRSRIWKGKWKHTKKGLVWSWQNLKSQIILMKKVECWTLSLPYNYKLWLKFISMHWLIKCCSKKIKNATKWCARKKVSRKRATSGKNESRALPLQFTSFYLYSTYWSCKQCHMKHLWGNRHCLHLRQESAIIYIWWCLRHFSLSPLRLLWSWGKSCLFVSGSVWSSESVSELRAWGIKMPNTGGGGISSWAYFLRQTA